MYFVLQAWIAVNWVVYQAVLYALVNSIIGPEVLTEVRQTTTNLRYDINWIYSKLDNVDYVMCYSGSKAEGFRFKSSDEDWMNIYKDIKVIPCNSYMALYDSKTTLLLMENEMTKPGFTFLRLICGSMKPQISRSTEIFHNGNYLSCKHWRELHTGFHVKTRIHTRAMCKWYNVWYTGIWPSILSEEWYLASKCPWLYQKTKSLWMAISRYSTQHFKWWCPLCSDWSQAVSFWEYWMENVILFSRKETN